MIDRQSHWQQVYTTKHENEVSWFQAVAIAAVVSVQPLSARVRRADQ